MGILLGVLTALTWGGSDFLARFATQRMGTLRTMLYMQFTGFILLTIALPWLGGWGHLADGSGWQPWAWGALAGCVNAVSTLSLYRSFEIGKMAVVAPLSASYPVLSVSLSLVSGERLSLPRAIGIACTMLGVLLVAGGEKPPDENDVEAVRRSGKGISWALSSAAGFGVLFWLLGTHVIPRVGAPQTVWMIRLTCTAVVTAVILLARQPIGLPRNTRLISLGMGAGDTSAFVLSNRAMQIEQVAVISVLGSLYGAVTVALAAIVLREHVSRWQWAGIASIFSGIYLMSR
ncbi:MAG TPA: DMT family transporter [Candidatus Saccharimonadales bacterium]|nr:DMT family transporter [Candidatus Saccharimonadales bacterium]